MIAQQTIQEIAPVAQQGLWNYLAQLPFTLEASMMYALVLGGTLGMIGNYTIKWLRGDIEGSLIDYCFRYHFKATLLSFFGFLGLAITSVYSGIFTSESGGFVGWANVLWFGLTNGFAVDAIANKGKRAVWTAKKRKAKK